ncbi:19677_t:CDS:2 [Rhizophagus irregularis]|nr:19677_t:CDS:2 [Rhizophagus irregularis]
MGFEDGMSYQDKLPWQNASQLDRQNQDDGSGEVFLLINSDFGGRRGDNMVHVQASICKSEICLHLWGNCSESIPWWDKKKLCHLVLPDDRPKI